MKRTKEDEMLSRCSQVKDEGVRNKKVGGNVFFKKKV